MKIHNVPTYAGNKINIYSSCVDMVRISSLYNKEKKEDIRTRITLHGYVETINYLIGNSMFDDIYLFSQIVIQHGNLDIIKYLYENSLLKGIDKLLIFSLYFEKFDIVYFLYNTGIDISKNYGVEVLFAIDKNN